MMKRRCFLSAIILLAVFLFPEIPVSKAYPLPGLNKNTKQSDNRDEKIRGMDTLETFEDLVKDCKKIDGLFTFFRNTEEGKTYLEIMPDQFEKIFLCSVTRVSGDGFFFDSAANLKEFPFFFKRVGKNVLFIHKNLKFRADSRSNIHRALERSISDSIVGKGEILSLPHPDRKSVLVDPSGFFIQDIGKVENIFGRRESFEPLSPLFLDRDTSFFGDIKSFEKNTEIEVVLHFQSSETIKIPTVPDSRSFQHTYNYSLSLIEDTHYRPRYADDRVGHFTTIFQNYDSVLKDTPYIRYINRWQLEKAEPKYAISPPKEPIVFWIENTVPVEYRDAIREGVLNWNKPFEAIGFKDAIVVRQQPDDATWKAADVRYNTICWIVTPGGGYAVGPSKTDPYNGRIFDGDIRISADIIRFAFRSREEFTEPLTPKLPKAGRRMPGNQPLCDYQWKAAEEAAFGSLLLEERAEQSGEIPDLKQYIHDFLVHIVCHEVGHVLGLRHNFKGSSIFTLDQLNDAGFTEKHGLSGSVMDYLPVHIVPKGKKQGPYFQTEPGPYDYWAIFYAYSPLSGDTPENEQAALEKIASRAAEPELAYGTDEDTMWGPLGVDPSCNRGDLGADPVEWFRERIRLTDELWKNLEAKFEKKGNRYTKLRHVFDQGIRQYFSSVGTMTKFVSGLFLSRSHVGDPNAKPPFTPVSASRQKEALNFLDRYIFDKNAFQFSPELLNKLGPERFNDFSGTIWKKRRIDYPIHDVIRRIQNIPLRNLYNPILLSRMLDQELRVSRQSETFTMADMFEMVRNSIWSEITSSPANINSMRRSLQRAHLDILINMLIQTDRDFPEDAVTLARMDLKFIRDRIIGIPKNADLDHYTKSHLDETRERIKAALSAGIERQLSLSGKSGSCIF